LQQSLGIVDNSDQDKWDDVDDWDSLVTPGNTQTCKDAPGWCKKATTAKPATTRNPVACPQPGGKVACWHHIRVEWEGADNLIRQR
jgi:hypothetical protein